MAGKRKRQRTRVRGVLDVELVPDANEKAQPRRMWPKGTPMQQIRKGQ